MRGPAKTKLPFRDVVLVADSPSNDGHSGPLHLRRDLETTDSKTLTELVTAITELGLGIHHYTDPRTLGENASRHAEDLVLSIYGGQCSRNRMALVPAICETYGLSFVGPDVYGRVICQDKDVTKNLAREFGIRTPGHRLIRGEDDLNVASTFPVPFVVKPVLEGSSIGISGRSLVHDARDGVNIARELLMQLRQPVMIEEFVPGREVSYSCIEAESENYWAYAEVRVRGRDDYFDSHLFDAEEKLNRHLFRSVHAIDHALSPGDRARCNNLLKAIGRFGYCRVDGKHENGRFVFLEVTPDAWIAPAGAFAGGFIDKGWAYRDVIAAVLSSAVPALRDRLANG